jgi:hypothetical protein
LHFQPNAEKKSSKFSYEKWDARKKILKRNGRMEVNLLVNILIAIIHALAHYSLLPFLHNIRYQQTDSLFQYVDEL